jgi:hypothetical protein
MTDILEVTVVRDASISISEATEYSRDAVAMLVDHMKHDFQLGLSVVSFTLR